MGFWQVVFGNRPPKRYSKSSRTRHRSRRPGKGHRTAAGHHHASKSGGGFGKGRKRVKRRRSRFSGKPGQRHSRFRTRCVVAYHGTPSVENAKSIIRDGFKIGSGNALGDGVYLTRDLSVAKTYAGSNGVYLRCLVQLGRNCNLDDGTRGAFAAWCRSRGASADNSALTAFLMQRGYDTVYDAATIVVLSPQCVNSNAWKRRDLEIRILSVHKGSDGRRIRV
jgi:hypothetical protein